MPSQTKPTQPNKHSDGEQNPAINPVEVSAGRRRTEARPRAACPLSDWLVRPSLSRGSPSEPRPLLQSGSAEHRGRGSARLERGLPDLRAPADGPGLLKSQAAPTAPEVKTD